MSRRGAARVLILPLALLSAALTESHAAAEIEYLRTLKLPAQTDSVAYPKSVTADLQTGEIFVCDARGNRILIFDRDGLFDYEINGGTVFRGPRDIGVDPQGYIVLLANRAFRRGILELDFDGLFLREIELHGLPPEASEPHLISLALSQTGDRIFLLDQANLRVWIADRDGGVQGSIDLGVGLTDNQRRDALFGHVDVSGDRVLVTFPRVGRVRSYDLEGNLIGSIGATGKGKCELSFPVAAAVDAKGTYLVVDSHQMVLTTWEPVQDACLGTHYGYGTDPGYLYFPTDLALDADGQIYISQPFEGRIQVYRGEAAAARTSLGTEPP